MYIVVLIHVPAHYQDLPGDLRWFSNLVDSIFDVLRKLAIPFFFMAAGCFYGKSFQKGIKLSALYWRYFSRLLIIFLGWSFIYSLPWPSEELFKTIAQHGVIKAYYWHLQYALPFIPPAVLFMSGLKGHLWFIMALLQSLTVITVFLSLKKEKALLYFALLLFTFTPLLNLYLRPLASNDYAWNPLIGPFISTIYVVCGWWFAKGEASSIKLAFILILAGLAGNFLEGRFLESVYHISSPYQNLGVIPMSLGVFMLALARPNLGANSPLPRLGQLTLGVYCSHLLFIDSFDSFKDFIPPIIWNMFLPLAIYGLSLFLTVCCQKIPIIRRLFVMSRK